VKICVNGVDSCQQNFVTNRLLISAKKRTRRRCATRIAKVREQLGREYPLVIGGERITTDGKLDSINPANRTQLVGRFNKATKELANQRSRESRGSVSKRGRTTPAEERAELLFRVRRDSCANASMSCRVDDPRGGEDVADGGRRHCRSIDFAEFYAREMLRYAAKQPIVNVPVKIMSCNTFQLGVGAVIPPWNFPLAIMAA
jgi:1-pyrroline-5-carboxylate dehydrogenase